MTNTIYIATPTFNSGATLDTTILSVIAQEGDFSIRYHVQDGGSDDSTWHKLKHWQTLIDGGYFPKRCRSVDFTYTREPDRGMYDALYKSFLSLAPPPDAFVSWINSDDWFNQGVFGLVQGLASHLGPEELSWLTGNTSVHRNNLFNGSFQNRSPQNVVQAGLCDGKHWPFFQQEGTFFRQSLLEKIDLEQDFRRFRLAGDWNLWRRFANHAVPVSIDYPLAVFRSHAEQLTAKSYDKYLAEIEREASKEKRHKAAQGFEDSEHSYLARIIHAPYPMTEVSCVNVVIDHPFAGMFKK